MNKEQIKERFRKITKFLEDESTIEIKNEHGVVTAKGILIDRGTGAVATSSYVTYGLDDDFIHFYSEGKELLKVDEESPIIEMIEFVLGYMVEI